MADGERLAREWAAAGFANAMASGVLNPMDVIKTRLQVEKVTTVQSIVRAICREAGILGLWKPGLSASMARELLYSGPRAGFYVPLRDALQVALHGPDDRTQRLSTKILAALTTGTIGSLIANPVDVVKIRMMVDAQRYRSLVHGLTEVCKHEGVHGLYKGVAPSTLRGAMIAVGELATYDQSKHMLKDWAFEEGWLLHIASSLITGLVATTIAAPFDLLKSRSMANAHSSVGLASLAAGAVREEGLKVLVRGWLPAYCRLGPHAIICFPIFEQFRRLLGLECI